MKRFSLSLLMLLLLLSSSLVSAQSKNKKKSGGSSSGYTTGIGLRGGGYSSGLTVKHFLSGKNGVALEALVTTEYRARGARFTLLAEKHKAISDFKGLQFYYGAGFHLGSYQNRYYFDDARYYRYHKKNEYIFKRSYIDDDASYVAFGADLILGLEYKMEDLPFVVGVDYKPYFEVFNGYTGFYSDAAVSLRFTF
ncbi:hypothetical protein [Hymenobacter elongatus]|uniref:Outer membrane protein beta-barrel domain-containing protein n=1 Tax=Hymenobacter elongatus TaxID=877208 RepID=A0A4Z0PGM5_9BACT|nr:hypothetical protein [Hymenobacter elongatus]TGE14324.1 hypothetical protein E5J99_16465 [Hymenobacter elongatus]